MADGKKWFEDSGWYGVDFDATLVTYDKHRGVEHIGRPIPRTVEYVKKLLSEGKRVKIFTARVWPLGTYDASKTENKERVENAEFSKDLIRRWSYDQFGRPLEVTCIKDPLMIDMRDDRCTQVEPNTGRTIAEVMEVRIKKAARIAKNSLKAMKELPFSRSARNR